jgi:hypothetical protein
LADSTVDGPFLSPQWLMPWWQVYGPGEGRRPLLFTQWSSGQLIGFAPLLLRTHWYRPGFPVRRLEFWGSGEREAEAVCSDYLHLIARRGAEAEVAEGFAWALARRFDWEESPIPLMLEKHPLTAVLSDRLAGRGLMVQRTAMTEARSIVLPASWEEYLSQRKHTQRYWIRRTLRDFQHWTQGREQLRTVSSPSELAQGQQILLQLHHERWQGTIGGTFRTARFRLFHQHIQRTWLEAGRLHLSWFSLEEQPVAALYNLLWRNKMYFYQCGRSLRVPRGVRPGAAILISAIQFAINNSYNEFDFLGGNTGYKNQFATESRPLIQLRVARPGWREQVRELIQWGKKHVRRWRPCPVEAAEDE